MTFPRLLHNASDRVLVAGESRFTLDLLRLATIRTDDDVLITQAPDQDVRRIAERFTTEIQDRTAKVSDLETASAAQITIGDLQAEIRRVRAARRQRVPVHVAGRERVSDFRMLDLSERPSLAA